MVNAKEIVKLLAEGKKDKAKALLVELLDSVELTNENKGQLYAQLAKLFMETQEELSAKYVRLLNEAADALKPLQDLKSGQ